jgi:hypothetical protein
MTELELVLSNIYKALESGEVTREDVAGLIGHIALSELAKDYTEAK